MSRSELIRAVAARSALSTELVEVVLGAIEDELVARAAAGEHLRSTGVLSLDVTARPARAGRHPQTGETMTIAKGHQVRIRVGSRLKRAVRDV